MATNFVSAAEEQAWNAYQAARRVEMNEEFEKAHIAAMAATDAAFWAWIAARNAGPDAKVADARAVAA